MLEAYIVGALSGAACVALAVTAWFALDTILKQLNFEGVREEKDGHG